MKEQQARQLVIDISRRFADIIRATLDDSAVREGDRGWSVHLLFLPGTPDQRSASVNSVVEWAGLLDAWSVLSPELEKLHTAKPFPGARKTGRYYLVNNIPMTFHRRKSGGHWFGYYYQNGKTYQQYLGRADPRAIYPPCDVGRQEAWDRTDAL
jgi:hypothetical protein